MFYTKALLTVLASISLCMANISGVVTDSAGVKIAGAIVKLELGGQTDTTDSDGSFILTTGIASVSSHLKTLQGNLFASIQDGLLYVNVTGKTVLQITTFDLNGKMLSAVHQSVVAGIHSIGLPNRGTGIYLYKINAGNNEVVLKENSFNGVSSGGVVSLQGSSSNNSLAKQAKVTAAIKDIIAVTKTGYLNFRVVAYNLDTTGIAIKMIVSAGNVTDVDGNVYQTVKIGNQVWTVENLRVTKYNDGSLIPFVSDSIAWCRIFDSSLTTPAYSYYKNTTNADSIKKYGPLYNWYVVSPKNPKKIAPTGWHLPSDAEWDTLQNYLIAKGYNWDGTITENKIAKSLASKTDWSGFLSSFPGIVCDDLTKNNSSGFSALPGGFRHSFGNFLDQRFLGNYWTTTDSSASGASYRYLEYNRDYLTKRDYCDKNCGFSVRLIRD